MVTDIARCETKAETPPAEPQASALLTEEQLAALLSLQVRTLRLWRRTRGLPHLRLTAKVIRYRYADVAGWLNARRFAITT